MLIIIFALLLASLPLIMTTAFPHLMVVSIYSGVGFLLALLWALLIITIITIIARRHRISEWRQARAFRKQAKKLVVKKAGGHH